MISITGCSLYLALCAGAVAARMRVYDTSVCIISAHLSSGENDGDELKRNYDYSEIMRRGAFPNDSLPAVDPQSVAGSQPDAVPKV